MYQEVPRSEQLAYNVAFCDAFFGPHVLDINTEKYEGKPKRQIIIHAKDNFRMNIVFVSIINGEGNDFEEGYARAH